MFETENIKSILDEKRLMPHHILEQQIHENIAVLSVLLKMNDDKTMDAVIKALAFANMKTLDIFDSLKDEATDKSTH